MYFIDNEDGAMGYFTDVENGIVAHMPYYDDMGMEEVLEHLDHLEVCEGLVGHITDFINPTVLEDTDAVVDYLLEIL